jgi:hypothetical protein
VGIAGEVLAQLDQAAADFMFPDLNHGYYYAVDAQPEPSVIRGPPGKGGRTALRRLPICPPTSTHRSPTAFDPYCLATESQSPVMACRAALSASGRRVGTTQAALSWG